MVDVDRRPTGPNPAHAAGLRRLSARAASVSTPTVRNRNSLHSFSALSEKVITHLSSSGIQLHPSHGAEFARSADSDPILRKQRSVSAARFPVPGFSRHSLDAAVDLRRRSKWVEGYVGMMGSVLREGGWSESDISEMVSGSGSVLLDNEEVLDALVSKAERFSDSLRKSGWSSEEVKDALGLDLRPEKKGGRPPKKVATQLVGRIGKLVESVSRS
ncbi:hypothetical protein AAZX31_17G167400 [Glycine max]|uniref:Uncharacterized protein n=3 Tax=Glycine subgen. Soja TaxID=1462606 RepID=I1MVX8_SOYBN|nr:hypothetical protein JHK85_048359 [Glycine max]RZB57332.1 hypothetical protein D0Y65_046132 [Glycine soja]KAG5102792.1 hypothetical protein JHK84_047761 [Glycine max]KAH1118890.1 hypothetical protein GYH30_047609 [Glycine max]KAH1202777.1 hypothetical protein GmHk_17G049162 [Glycine max]